MTKTFEDRCIALIEDLGIGTEADVLEIRPLSGGVSSDIGVVWMQDKSVCVKFALGKLKVAADWHAPVHRNRAEYEWLRFAGIVAPDNCPDLFGCSAKLQGFAMKYLDEPGIFLWKSRLLAGDVQQGNAAMVADLLGRLHAASALPKFNRTPFQNIDDFRHLRLEPYLTYTAGRHPAVAQRLSSIADTLYAAADVLVHGDVSPKNILFRNGQPVFLDAECATMGDASFDPAFCLNHLVLKAIHMPAQREILLYEAADFWKAYASHIDWEESAALEARTALLLPALMLARVDGKSPVEYLDDSTRDAVRVISLDLIASPSMRLDELLTRLKTNERLQ